MERVCWSLFFWFWCSCGCEMCASVRVSARPLDTHETLSFFWFCSVSGLQTCAIGCKAPELRPVKILIVTAATGVIKQPRVHQELLSNRADRVGPPVYRLKSSELLHSLAPFSTTTNEVWGKTQIIHQKPWTTPPPHHPSPTWPLSHFNMMFQLVWCHQWCRSAQPTPKYTTKI